MVQPRGQERRETGVLRDLNAERQEGQGPDIRIHAYKRGILPRERKQQIDTQVL